MTPYRGERGEGSDLQDFIGQHFSSHFLPYLLSFLRICVYWSVSLSGVLSPLSTELPEFKMIEMRGVSILIKLRRICSGLCTSRSSQSQKSLFNFEAFLVVQADPCNHIINILTNLLPSNMINTECWVAMQSQCDVNSIMFNIGKFTAKT